MNEVDAHVTTHMEKISITNKREKKQVVQNTSSGQKSMHKQ